MLTLNHQHLYYFWIVAREGSVTRACRMLCLAQPTVSGQVIQLEKSLGHPLFHREKNRLLLTEMGRLVLAYADDIFGTSQRLIQDVKEGIGRRARRLRIGIDTHITKAAALQLLSAVRRHDAEIDLTLQEGPVAELLQPLRTHELDLVLSEQGGTRVGAGPLVTKEVGQLDIFFVAAPKVARQVASFPRDLANIPLLLPSPDSPMGADIERFLGRHEIKPSRRWQIQHVDFMHQLALEGQGAAPLHEISVSADLKSGRLIRLGARPTGITKTLWLLSHPARFAHPAVDHLWKHFWVG